MTPSDDTRIDRILFGISDWPLADSGVPSNCSTTRVGWLADHVNKEFFRIDYNEAERAGMIDEIGDCKENTEPALPALQKAMLDDYQVVRRAAVKALGKIGAASIPILNFTLRGWHLDGTCEIAEALRATGLDADTYLIDALKDKTETVRLCSANAIGETPQVSDKIILALIERFNDPEPSVRMAAATSLGKIGVPAIQPLMKRLETGVLDNRWYTIVALEKMGSVAEPYLIAALGDKQASVRWFAVTGIARVGTPSKELNEKLFKLLSDADPYVRMGACYAMKEKGIASDDVIAELAEMALKDEDKLVNWAAIDALGKFGPAAKNAVSALETIAAGEEKLLATHAEAALSKITQK